MDYNDPVMAQTNPNILSVTRFGLPPPSSTSLRVDRFEIPVTLSSRCTENWSSCFVSSEIEICYHALTPGDMPFFQMYHDYHVK